MSNSSRIVCPHCAATNRVPLSRDAAEAKCGACNQPLFAGAPIEVDAEAFDKHVRNNDVPVLVDVWAPWCGPCRAMAPMFARAATQLEPEVRLLKLNSDEAPEISARFEIRAIPTMLLFHHGRILARTSGAADGNAIIRWVREQLATAR